MKHEIENYQWQNMIHVSPFPSLSNNKDIDVHFCIYSPIQQSFTLHIKEF